MCIANDALLNIGEHTRCKYYNHSETDSLVQIIELNGDKMYECKTSSNEIIFICSGNLHLSLNGNENIFLNRKMFFSLPPECSVTASVTQKTQLIICKLKEGLGLCENMHADDFSNPIPSGENTLAPLIINKHLQIFLNGLTSLIQSDFKCNRYLQLKINELLFYLKIFYTQQQQADLFNPLVSKLFLFRNMIYFHLRKDISTAQLVALSGMSRSNFEVQFKAAFKENTRSFLNRYKAENIRLDLQTTRKEIKQIYEEYGFSEQSSFTRFCKKHLNKTPVEIRKESTQS